MYVTFSKISKSSILKLCSLALNDLSSFAKTLKISHLNLMRYPRGMVADDLNFTCLLLTITVFQSWVTSKRYGDSQFVLEEDKLPYTYSCKLNLLSCLQFDF